MIISGTIQANSVLADPQMDATNKLYFKKSTGMTEANVLDDKIIFPKNIWGTPGTRQHDTHFSNATKVFYLLFGSEKHFMPIV